MTGEGNLLWVPRKDTARCLNSILYVGGGDKLMREFLIAVEVFF